MSLTLVTAPTVEPVTLAEVRAHCRVDHADDDGLLAGYILAAREHVEAYTRRAICTQTWDLKIDDDWPSIWDSGRQEFRPAIALPRPPFQSVASISYVDTAGATQTLAANQYQAVATNGQSRDGIVYPAYDVTWPSVRRQPQAITVRFAAGYGGLTDVPHRVRQAILLLIGHWYENREAVLIGGTASECPLAVDALLFPIRVFY